MKCVYFFQSRLFVELFVNWIGDEKERHYMNTLFLLGYTNCVLTNLVRLLFRLELMFCI